jgi:tetratricopeptide (TPR) repeat protein
MTRQLTTILLTIIGLTVLFGAPLVGAKHENWVEVRSPNFIIVSNAGERQARKAAIHFEQIRAVFRRSLTVANAHGSPTITIFAVKDEDSLKALLPEYWVKGHTHPAGIFFYRMNQYFAAIQLDAPGSNPYSTFYHEYYHSLTLPYYPNLPLWVAEGLADFYGNTEVSSSEVGMGRPDPDLIGELRQGNFIPLDVLFKVDHSSPYYNEQNETSIFYAESWALTHYLLVGDKATHKPMLTAYLNELSHGATQEEAATKSFGDLKKLQETLYSYIRSNAFFYLKSPPPPEISTTDLQARELSEAEVDAYRGGFAVVRGRVQDGIPILQEAVKLDPKLALGYQYLGFAEYLNNQRSEALADFTRAIELNPQNALTRFLRAYLTYSQARATGDDAQLEEDLRAAIAASPEFAPPYGMLGVYLSGKGENLPEALEFAKKAQSLEPGNTSYQFDLAQVLARMNRYNEASAIALGAKANSTSPEERAHLDLFLEYLKQAQSASFGRPQISGGITDAANQPAIVKRLNVESGSKDSAISSVEGSVKQVTCTGNELVLTLDAVDGFFILHARDATRVSYEKDVAFDSGDFNACSQLKGHEAKITFVEVSNQKYDGEIQAVEVLK